jgi:hypothetical protein
VEGGKKKDVRVDGKGGIDNTFGKNILPRLDELLDHKASAQANQAILQGQRGLVLWAGQLGSQRNYTGVEGQLFAVKGNLLAHGTIAAPTAAQWASGDFTWRPLSDHLAASGASQTDFPQGYLASNTLVSGPQTSFVFPLSFQGFTLDLIIHQGQIAVQLDETHRTGASGVIGGILDPEELISSLRPIASQLSTTLCDPAMVDALTSQIKRFSDITLDGKQDPTVTCDGLSIGLGFETAAALLGDPTPATPPPPVPCAP